MLSQRLAPATPSRSDGLTSRDGAPPPRPALPSGANFLKAERVGRRHGRRAPMRRHPEGRRPHLLRSEPCSTVYATPARPKAPGSSVQQYHALRVAGSFGFGFGPAVCSPQCTERAANAASHKQRVSAPGTVGDEREGWGWIWGTGTTQCGAWSRSSRSPRRSPVEIQAKRKEWGGAGWGSLPAAQQGVPCCTAFLPMQSCCESRLSPEPGAQLARPKGRDC